MCEVLVDLVPVFSRDAFLDQFCLWVRIFVEARITDYVLFACEPSESSNCLADIASRPDLGCEYVYFTQTARINQALLCLLLGRYAFRSVEQCVDILVFRLLQEVFVCCIDQYFVVARLTQELFVKRFLLWVDVEID